ncbi:hypothetical protein CANARDRAFT_176179 [[Candida] arabinofermentans NRRL YB-2248]|uniref:Peptide transporter PTR2 n=1 Tax=[Candida] arabinofermentans NRRL YB-2248 TaxID=983967 RepID=A0A1E4T0E3_9ASCO|nr:hypothetical protein CANARDRAFT_176179 [[Candida] arabinofermentans NRRL YB-2248]
MVNFESDLQDTHSQSLRYSSDIELNNSLDDNLDEPTDYLLSPTNSNNTSTIDKSLYETLRVVPGKIPLIAYTICLVEFAERASYYGLTGCLTNFIARKLPAGSVTGAVIDSSNVNESAGALGLGLPLASFLTQMLSFLAYLSPLLGGYLADTKYGKFQSIVIGAWVGGFGHFLLFFAALPRIIEIVWLSLSLTVISIVTISMSAGFIKPALLPLLMDQYEHKKDYLKRLDTGELVIVQYKSTLERMSLIFYFFINCGCFVSLFAALFERAYGFWVVFFFTGVLYSCLPILLIYLKPRLKLIPPSGTSVYDEIAPLVKDLFQPGWFRRYRIDQFWSITQTAKSSISLEDLRRTCENCLIFLFFIPFNLNDGSIASIQITQSGTMETKGIPNDIFQSFNPLAILIFIPFQDYLLYPFLRKHKIEFPVVYRIAVGFVIAAVGSLIGALLQYLIYTTSPCGWNGATECETVAPISAWWCSWMFSLQAIGECFSIVTCYEIAYSRSGEGMKGMVVALFLCCTAVSALIGELISFVARDPYLFAIFLSCGLGGIFFTIVFLYTVKDMEE